MSKIILETIKKWFRKNGWECEEYPDYFVFSNFISGVNFAYEVPKNLTEKDKDDFIIFITDNI